MRRVLYIAAVLLATVLVIVLINRWPTGGPSVLALTGETMGTTYSVSVVDAPAALDEAALQAAVDAALDRVNAAMNNWDPGSEVSLFNASPSTAPTPISADFVKVMDGAAAVHDASGGAFDVTLAPVIELWGFGPRTPDSPVPPDDAIAAAMEHVGQARVLSLDTAAGALAKSDPAVSVNLSAIAKGHGVDAIADAVAALGAENLLVEIGGDLMARGVNADGVPWQIGIERPDGQGSGVQQIVGVPDLGLATSGDYRNYVEVDGVRYSHIIDATTGRPIDHRTASVTVLAETAMLADAWATAMLALGSERAMEIAAERDLAVFAIDRDDTAEGGFVTVASPAFDALLDHQ